MVMFYFEDHHGTEQTKKDNAGRNSHGISDHFQLERGMWGSITAFRTYICGFTYYITYVYYTCYIYVTYHICYVLTFVVLMYSSV
jgi:hypothetical protein